MANIVAISGSPTQPSRTFAVLDYCCQFLEQHGIQVSRINVRDLPAEDLLFGNYKSAAILQANDLVAAASGVLIATPVYKGTYTGVLKTYLDLLPQTGFAGKGILPVVVGGTIAHLLSIEYSLKPLFAILGARQLFQGVYIVDKQIQVQEGEPVKLDPEIEQRLKDSLGEFVAALG